MPALCARPNDPPACPAWGGVELILCPSRPEPPSVLRVRADCRGHLFRTKLDIVVHNLAHQLLDHLLSDDAILLARQFCDCLRDSVDDFICFSPADETVARSTWRTRCSGDPVSACLPPTPLHRCIGLRVRSLNDPHDARLRPFNRHTLEPAAASRCEPTHPSPSAC